MTNLDHLQYEKRLVMSEAPPADLHDNIKQAILDIVDRDDINTDSMGHITFTVKNPCSATILRSLLHQADIYELLDFDSNSNADGIKYTIFYQLFPELTEQSQQTRDDIQGVINS